MPIIKWDKSFSVYNAGIDEEHKTWIGIVNRMHESLLSDDYKAFNEKVEESIRELEDFTSSHFAFEEEYMSSINYPGLREHARKHREFSEYIGEGFRNIRLGHMLLKSNFIKMTRVWLIDHIMVEDKKYSLYAGEDRAQKEAAVAT